MLRNYFKIALRNLLRYKEFSLINIAGLAIGIASCIVILLLVRHELTFDRFHANADRICRVYVKLSSIGSTSTFGCVQGPLGPALKADFPEVSGYTRLLFADLPPRIRVSYKDKDVNIDNTYYTDPSIFQVFSFGLIEGDASTALVEPYTAVLTEEAARKIFGDEDPLGKVIQRDGKTDYKVTGVLKKIPRNSHLQFDMLLSMTELVNQPESQIHVWGIYNPYCYILLEPGTDIKRLEAAIRAYLKKYPETKNIEYFLQPLADAHLHSAEIQGELNWAESDPTYVYGICVLALVVLLIACFNFMNLSTARFAGRAREVGIRKVVGARRGQLIGQFLGESVLLSFLALLVAVALVELALPALNGFFDGVLMFNYLHDWHLVAGFVAVVICVGLIAGSYPAFFLSAFRPVNVLKSTPN
ncbi:MAG: ABC transporter permease, partial [Candidatus Glassbacteria bacterium]